MSLSQSVWTQCKLSVNESLSTTLITKLHFWMLWMTSKFVKIPQLEKKNWNSWNSNCRSWILWKCPTSFVSTWRVREVSYSACSRLRGVLEDKSTIRWLDCTPMTSDTDSPSHSSLRRIPPDTLAQHQSTHCHSTNMKSCRKKCLEERTAAAAYSHHATGRHVTS